MIDYLPHDITARNDTKLIKLQMEMGGVGYALYWVILEMLWANDGYMPADSNIIAYQIPWSNTEDITKVVANYNLFRIDGDRLYSPGLLKRLNARKAAEDRYSAAAEARSERAKAGADARWGGQKSDDAQAYAQASAQASAQADALINKLINKLINEEINKCVCVFDAPAGASAPEAAKTQKHKKDIFLILFSRNITNPASEMDRYWANYEATGWITKTGTKIKNKVAAARNWTPKSSEPAMESAVLAWWAKMVKACGSDIAPLLVNPPAIKVIPGGLRCLLPTKEIAQDWANLADAAGCKDGITFSIDPNATPRK